MKCPKCQYFSFDSGDRCRNCGYDFSLTLDLPPADLPIQNGTEPLGPFADFSLNDVAKLPLFTKEGGDPDPPVVRAGRAPRAPLAFRRTAPVTPRRKPRRETARVERDLAPRLALDTAELAAFPEPAPRAAPEAAMADPVMIVASAGARLLGAVIDAALVGGIDLAVVYFTLRICDLTFAQVLTLPMAPLLSFLVLLDGGYLSVFVAVCGQTIGKMAAGTRAVPAEPPGPPFQRAFF